ncbi:hypothetical protein MAJ_09820, partial [Metarhizium majus ARSEF 297]
MLNNTIAGRDLVAVTLSTPDEVLKSQALRDVVLGRAPYFRDQDAMVRRITNVESAMALITLAENPEDGRMPVSLDAWKLIVCDLRYLEENASLQDAYNAQLREEELQTPAERAREIVRIEPEKTARRNAKWFIPALEELAKTNQLDKADTNAIWKQGGRSLLYACIDKIHCNEHSSTARKLWAPVWPPGPLAGDLAADNAVRQHFRDYRGSLLSPGILRNTFIVIDASSIPENIEDSFITRACDIYWVWAYDADWEPLLPTSDTGLDEEEYQGRVKVAIDSLDAWFYAARYEGVDLYDMWLKAQKHPQKIWICFSKELEEWHHESYI